MKKLVKIVTLILIVAILCVACGKNADTKIQDSEKDQEELKEAGEDTENKGEAANKDVDNSGKVLTVYSPQADADRGAWISEKAHEALGFKVEFLTAAGGDLAERLRAEKNNPQADIIMGLVQTALYQLKDEGILEKYTPSWGEGLPEVYKDKDGYFMSFWQTPIVMAYNPDFLDNPPASWQDLIKDEYKDLYAVAGIGSQTTRTYILGFLWPYYDEATGEISDEGWDALRTLYANSYSLPTDVDTWKLYEEGKLPLALSWFGGVKNKTAEYEAPVEYIKPAEGTPVVAEGIAVVAGTKNAEMAHEFIEWWGKAETMGAYANEFGQAPAHPDAIALCNPEVKADAEMFVAQEIDWEIASSKMDAWFEKIELEIME